MNKKNQQLITTLVVYGALLYAATSCFIGIGAFGAYLNMQIIDKLGFMRFAAAGMAVWMMYILSARKKQIFQWVYVAITIIFIGACLASIQPGAFGTVPDGIVNLMPGSTPSFRILLIWIITGALLIMPSTKDIKLDSIKGRLMSARPDTGNRFSFPADAPVPSKELPAGGYKLIPLVRFGSLAGDKNFVKSKYSFPIGQKEDGRPLYAELGDDTPHFLIAGMTGSGKTVFLQTAIAALAYKNRPDDLRLILIDGVRRGFKPLEGLPHVIHGNVLCEDEDAVKALEYVYNEVKSRIRNDISMPKIVTVIDEVDGYFGEPKTKKIIEPLISYIVKRGRQFGIHLIMGSQRPSGELISPHIISMMERVCLKVKLQKYSENIIESPDGASLTGKGDLLYLSDGKLIHARGYYMDEKGKHEVSNFAAGVASMYPQVKRMIGAVVAGRDAAADEEDGEYAGVDDGIDLFVPDKNRAGVCMYDTKILPFEGDKNGVWGRMDGHTAIHTAPYSPPYDSIQDENVDAIQPHTDDHTDHTTARVRVTDDEIIEMVNGGGSYRDIAKFLKVSLWRVQEAVRKYKDSGGVIAE